MKDVYCWRVDREGGDERGLRSRLAYFSSEQEAEKAAELDEMDYPYHKVTQETITIYDTAIEFNPRFNKAAVVRGLSKLTAEERAALGLSK